MINITVYTATKTVTKSQRVNLVSNTIIRIVTRYLDFQREVSLCAEWNDCRMQTLVAIRFWCSNVIFHLHSPSRQLSLRRVLTESTKVTDIT